MPTPVHEESQDVTETLSNGNSTLRVLEDSPERFVVEATYAPGGARPPRHHHPAHAERFELTAGVLRVELDGSQRDVGAGESFDVPAGVTHRMWNPGTAPAVARWSSEPGGPVARFFRAMDRSNRTGSPSRLAVLAEHRDVLVPASPLLRLLVGFRGLLGRRGR